MILIKGMRDAKRVRFSAAFAKSNWLIENDRSRHAAF
jgi:hypothetical protein